MHVSVVESCRTLCVIVEYTIHIAVSFLKFYSVFKLRCGMISVFKSWFEDVSTSDYVFSCVGVVEAY
jgi:hypothetical protein